MKKYIDTKLALYPTSVTVISTMNGDKSTWTLAAHIGIIVKCLSLKEAK